MLCFLFLREEGEGMGGDWTGGEGMAGCPFAYRQLPHVCSCWQAGGAESLHARSWKLLVLEKTLFHQLAMPFQPSCLAKMPFQIFIWGNTCSTYLQLCLSSVASSVLLHPVSRHVLTLEAAGNQQQEQVQHWQRNMHGYRCSGQAHCHQQGKRQQQSCWPPT